MPEANSAKAALDKHQIQASDNIIIIRPLLLIQAKFKAWALSMDI